MRKGQLFPVVFESVHERVCVEDQALAGAKVLVRFSGDESSGVTVLEGDDLDALRQLDRMGFGDVRITHLAFLPSSAPVEHGVEFFRLKELAMDDKAYLLAVYSMCKNMRDKQNSGVLVKVIAEHMYNMYAPDLNSVKGLSVEEVYNEFRARHTMLRAPVNALVDVHRFCNILAFLGYQVQDNRVLFLSIGGCCMTSVDLGIQHPLNNLLKLSFVSKKSHQLRGEPPCSTTTYTGPWNLSPHV